MKHQCARCGFESGRRMWWDRHPVDGVPGMFGPRGYTPVTEQPVPGVCTDFRAACPSS